MKICEIVADQRRRLGLKQYQLAERIGIAPSQLSIFERGNSGMVTTNLEKVLEALGLHIVYDRLGVQRDIARKAAQALRENGMTDVRNLSREEVAALTKNEDILLMPMVSEELYRKYCKSELVDETNTWNHFSKMIQDALVYED